MRGYYVILGLLLVLASLAQAQLISRIEVFPSNISIASGHSVRFTVIAYTNFGTVFTPDNVVWTTNGGTIDQSGFFTAGSYYGSGSYRVTAQCQGRQDSAQVQIRSGGTPHQINRIVITPDNAQVYVNQGIQFTATAYNAYGQTSVINAAWSATGGSIDPNGYYRASYTAGYYQVTVRDLSTGNQATANVRVLGGSYPYPTPPTPPTPPYPPTPYPSTARIVVTDFDTGGNWLEPKVKVTVQVFGSNIQTVRLFAVSHHSTQSEIDAQACSNGQTVYLKGRFERLNTRHFEIRLYDNFNREVARETRRE